MLGRLYVQTFLSRLGEEFKTWVYFFCFRLLPKCFQYNINMVGGKDVKSKKSHRLQLALIPTTFQFFSETRSRSGIYLRGWSFFFNFRFNFLKGNSQLRSKSLWLSYKPFNTTFSCYYKEIENRTVHTFKGYSGNI